MRPWGTKQSTDVSITGNRCERTGCLVFASVFIDPTLKIP
jgi:hypothetical protein